MSNYQERKQKIKTGLSRIAQGFVEIGYELKLIRDKELYKLDAYSSITEFAKAEYNLNHWDTSRFIAINDRYADNNGPQLLSQYEGYGYSKLTEMLSLSEDELQLVTLQTSRAEIREIKQAKKEAEEVKCAPAHMEQTVENTQSERDSKEEKKYNIPDAEKLLIEFFRDKSRRNILGDLAAVLSQVWKPENEIKVSEIINPSGHLLFRHKFVVMIFEEDHIKYNRFAGATTQYTYGELAEDLSMVFEMTDKDPWVAFYGEPEPDPEPEKKEPEKKIENKPEIKINSKPEAKGLNSKPATPDRKEAIQKPMITQSKEKKPDENESHAEVEEEDPEDQEEDMKPDIIPGQKNIEDYPEYMPEQKPEMEEHVEIVETDIVEKQKGQTVEEKEKTLVLASNNNLNICFDQYLGELSIIIKNGSSIKSIKAIKEGTGNTWEVAIE